MYIFEDSIFTLSKKFTYLENILQLAHSFCCSFNLILIRIVLSVKLFASSNLIVLLLLRPLIYERGSVFFLLVNNVNLNGYRKYLFLI